MGADLNLQLKLKAIVDGLASIQAAVAEVDKLKGAAGGAAPATGELSGKLDAAAASGAKAGEGGNAAAAGFEKIFSTATKLLGIEIGLGLVKQLEEISDAAKNVESRLRLATDSEEAFRIANEGVRQISQQTGVALEATADLYFKLGNAVKTTGGNQQDLLTITKAVNESIALSGINAQTAANGILQFSQGLASGRLQGQDLKAVLEDIPALGQAIAQSMGISIGKLRQLGEEGALTPQVILAALEKAAPQLEQKFGQVIETFGRALTNLKTSVIEAVGDLDKATAGTKPLIEAIDSVSKTIRDLGSDSGIRAAFEATSSAFKGLLVDPIKVGVDLVKAAFFGLAAAIDLAASGIAVALSKITFGETSAKFKEAADSLAQTAKEAGERAAKAIEDASKDGQKAIDDQNDALGAGVAAFVQFGDGAEKSAERVKQANQETGHSFTDAASAAKAAAGVFSQDLSPAAQKLVTDFKQAQQGAAEGGAAIRQLGDAARETGPALKSLFEAFNPSSVQSIRDVVGAMDELRAQGVITGQVYERSIKDLINGIAAKDLPAFAEAARTAFGQSADDASKLGDVMDTAVGRAFDVLGLKSAKFLQDTANAARGAFDIIVASGQASELQIQQAFDAMAAAQLRAAAAVSDFAIEQTASMLRAQATTQEEIDAINKLEESLLKAARAGTLLGEDISAGASKGRASIDGLKSSVDGIGGSASRAGSGFSDFVRGARNAANAADDVAPYNLLFGGVNALRQEFEKAGPAALEFFDRLERSAGQPGTTLGDYLERLNKGVAGLRKQIEDGFFSGPGAFGTAQTKLPGTSTGNDRPDAGGNVKLPTRTQPTPEPPSRPEPTPTPSPSPTPSPVPPSAAPVRIELVMQVNGDEVARSVQDIVLTEDAIRRRVIPVLLKIQGLNG